jgi:hypothetical protein
MAHPHSIALFSLLLTLSFLGCATEDEGAVFSGEAFAGGGGDFDWDARFVAIEDLLAREAWKPALDLIDASFAAEIPPVLAGRLGVLEFRAKRGYLRDDCLDASIVIDADRYEIGDVIDGYVQLKNLSREEIRIPAIQEVPEPEGRGTVATKTVFSRTVNYREYVPDDTLVTQTDTRNLIVDEDIVLDPGETFQIPVGLDTSVNNLEGRMLRRYDFDCSLRSARIEVGNRVFDGELAFRPARALVYPLGAEHLRADPLARVNEAIAKRATIHLTLAASLVPVEKRESLLRRLEEVLKASPTDSDLTRAVMCSLSIVTNDERRRDREEWLDWLRRRDR